MLTSHKKRENKSLENHHLTSSHPKSQPKLHITHQDSFNMRHRKTIFLNSSKLSWNQKLKRKSQYLALMFLINVNKFNLVPTFPSLSMSKQRIMSCNSSSVHVKSCTVANFATSLRVMNPFPASAFNKNRWWSNTARDSVETQKIVNGTSRYVTIKLKKV